MGYGIQSFQMSGGAGDWIKKAHHLHLITDSMAMFLRQSPVPNTLGLMSLYIYSGLTWKSHIDRTTGNANKTLGFLKCNIKTKMPRIRETAYNTLVRPELEYASSVSDPHTKDKVNQIEMVQRRPARWTLKL